MAMQACPRCSQFGLYHNSEEWICMICGATPYLRGGKFLFAQRSNEGDDYNTIMGGGEHRRTDWHFWGK